MTLSANQPYFLPYFPYWQLIASSDAFLIGDDYAYMKASWIPRNRILVNGHAQYFRIEVDHKSCHKLIKDCSLAEMDMRPKLRTLEKAYRKAPCFQVGYALAERILLYPERDLTSFLMHSIREICDYMGIGTPLLKTSDLPGNSLLRKEERIYDFCHRLGACRYINAIGGQGLYSKEAFRREGIELCFLCSETAPYRQFGHSFTPGLSIIDAVMFNSREELHQRLGQYRLV